MDEVKSCVVCGGPCNTMCFRGITIRVTSKANPAAIAEYKTVDVCGHDCMKAKEREFGGRG